MTDIWYSPNAIAFREEQVVWLMQNLEILKGFDWPKEPDAYITQEYVTEIKEDGRKTRKLIWVPKKKGTATNAPIPKAQIRTTAYFTKIIDIGAEVEIRLEKAGLEGKLLLAEVRAGIEHKLCPESKRALDYISGWRRKRMNYFAWRKQRRFRNEPLG